jgi:transcriptional regulator with XRE-family HTH domain
MADTAPKSLGELIRDARVEAKKGLREFARELDITPSYQSDIENDRRVPAEDVLKKTADLLTLNFDDLMALAGRVGEQGEKYLKNNLPAWSLLRRISEKNLSADQLKMLKDMAEKMGGTKGETS